MDMILSMFTGMNLPGSSSHSGSGRRHQAADHVTLYYKNDMDSDLSIVWKRPVGFLDMPPELQTKILMYLPVENTKQARLVCTSWCDLIDSARAFSIIVNDKKYDYASCKFPPWKITSCLIKHFQNHVNINFLPFPGTLRKLYIWGPISQANFHILLEQACNLEDLNLACDFFSSCTDIWSVNGIRKVFNLRHLRKLTIFSNHNIIYNSENLLGLFYQYMPSLTKLKITIEDTAFSRNALVLSPLELNIAARLVRFISTLKNLKVLHVSIAPNIFSDEELARESANLLRDACPNYEENLSRINLKICRLYVSPLYTSLLQPLVASQKGLKDFRIQSQFIEGLPIIYQNVENSLRFSIETLQCVHLEWVSKFPVHPMTVVNFNLFSEAKNLKRLILKRWWKLLTNPHGMAKISHLDCIPQSLEHLTIEGFICSTGEIKVIAESPSIMLTEIHLIQVGLFGNGVGLDGDVTKALCNKETVNHLSLGPLKNRVPDVEDKEFQELREIFKNNNFRSGKTVEFCLRHYKTKQEMKRKKEMQTTERRNMLFSCLTKN